jgi:hypothetical protein
MNFNQMMNWILGRSMPAQSEDDVQNFKRPAAKSERRISHRLSNSSGIVQIGGIGEFPLKDLSQGGLSLNISDFQGLPASIFIKDKVLSARLLLGSVFFEIELRVCSVRNDEIGCSFSSMPFGHSRVLHDFIKPVLLGRSIREIKATEANLRWFQGDDETQILYWTRPEGGLEKAEFYFLDYLISFDGKDNSLKQASFRRLFLVQAVIGLQVRAAS